MYVASQNWMIKRFSIENENVSLEAYNADIRVPPKEPFVVYENKDDWYLTHSGKMVTRQVEVGDVVSVEVELTGVGLPRATAKFNLLVLNGGLQAAARQITEYRIEGEIVGNLEIYPEYGTPQIIEFRQKSNY